MVLVANRRSDMPRGIPKNGKRKQSKPKRDPRTPNPNQEGLQPAAVPTTLQVATKPENIATFDPEGLGVMLGTMLRVAGK
jgi:hypothetical protein